MGEEVGAGRGGGVGGWCGGLRGARGRQTDIRIQEQIYRHCDL